MIGYNCLVPISQTYLQHSWLLVAGQLDDRETVSTAIFNRSTASLRLVSGAVLLLRLGQNL